MSKGDALYVDTYLATEEFRSIDHHRAVARSRDGGLVAVTGPALDPEAIRYARLFAAAPLLLKALERFARGDAGPEAKHEARAAIAAAEGES